MHEQEPHTINTQQSELEDRAHDLADTRVQFITDTMNAMCVDHANVTNTVCLTTGRIGTFAEASTAQPIESVTCLQCASVLKQAPDSFAGALL